MGSDFSRDSFDPTRHFSRVLTQQGRVQLDADANEQSAILLHYLRALAADLIGPYGGPYQNLGFQIGLTTDTSDPKKITDLTIGSGRYYVDGILCENEPGEEQPAAPPPNEVARPRGRAARQRAAAAAAQATTATSYYNQPDLYLDQQQDRLPDALPFLVYLDVWEREITAIEAPEIRDPALGANGPDTATRAKVVWQVRVTEQLPPNVTVPGRSDEQIQNDMNTNWPAWIAAHRPPNRGRLQAKGRDDVPDETDVCVVDPASRYRGEENQLYRVEIHTGGPAGTASFKWSRDNGSIVFPITSLEDRTVTLSSLGRDMASGLEVEDWVEIVDDSAALRIDEPDRARGALLQIDTIEPIDQRVTLAKAPDTDVGHDTALHPLLRRWDQQAGDTRRGYPEINDDGTLKLREDTWFTLEDGVQISFQAAPQGQDAHQYRAGDYWLIPARVATGDVIWPQEAAPSGGGMQDARPKALPPHGVDHHYAPLVLVVAADRLVDLRARFNPLIELFQQKI
jgi:hypothetical protein